MPREKITTQRLAWRSRGESGETKARRRTVSTAFICSAWRSHFAAICGRNSACGRYKAEAHCLRSEGLAPRPLAWM